jgi:phosphoribosylamine--glycine ligase
MLVAGGYPGEYEKGFEIKGLDEPNGSIIFHAGTTYDENTGMTLTNGGRVIAISAMDNTTTGALASCYKTAEIISFEGVYFRNDIGRDVEV